MENKIIKDGIEYYDYNNPNRFFEKIHEYEKLLKENNFKACICLGTLLGCVREKDILAHDDDFDVCYFSNKIQQKDVLDEFETTVKPILEKNGWITKPIQWFSNGKKRVLMGQYHIIKDNISLDLWVGWFNNKGRLTIPMGIFDAPIYKKDVFPFKKGTIRNYTFDIPNTPELFFKELYGENWRTPDLKYKTPVSTNFFKSSMLKVIDQFGWAYYFIAKEQQKYSYQKINYKRIADMNNHDITEDVVYFHSPGMGEDIINDIIHNKIDRNKTKIIGAYGGENQLRYDDADLILTISFPFLNKLKAQYPNKPVIFLPEAIDIEYFSVKRRKRKSFNVGYVGRPCKVKRMHLLDRLDFDVATHTEWGPKYFVEGRTLDNIKDFYKSIDCLVLTSQSECMPRVVLEAMSMGLPVISTDVGCLRMLLEPEWIVPNSSEEDIVKNINDRLHILKKYPDVRQEVGKRNRKHIEKYFGWEQVQQKWDDVINALTYNKHNKIKEIGKTFEDQWDGLYEDYNVINRKDTKNTFIETKKEVIKPTDAPMIKWKTIDVKNISQNNTLLNSIIMSDTVFLKESCKQIINNGALMGDDHYIGVNKCDLDDFKKNLRNAGWVETLANIFSKEEVTLRVEIYNGKIKRHGCKNYTVNVPFPVVGYLETTFGHDWRIK